MAKKNHTLRETDINKNYSFLWSRYRNSQPLEYHFNRMEEVIPEKIVRGKTGLDLGCGPGWDTYIMAKNNPKVKIIGMDISDGVYYAKKINRLLNNVSIVRGSAANIPLKDEACDFVYSFGVLHHMPDYKKGLSEIKRVLKKGGPCFLYLYEDHSDNPFKSFSIKIIGFLKRVTIVIPPKMLYAFSFIFSPILVIVFSYPARFFKKFKLTYNLYQNTPFNFGESLFSLSGDIYDRFSAPIEHRFNREELYKVFHEFNFSNIKISKLKSTAGWVIWGHKDR